MSTTHTETPEFAGVSCPSWCTLTGRELHDFASDTLHGQPARAHGGPGFGKHLSAFATETVGTPGMLDYAVLHQNDGQAISEPSELLELATHAIAAAQWLEDHRWSNTTTEQAGGRA